MIDTVLCTGNVTVKKDEMKYLISWSKYYERGEYKLL